MKQTKKEIEQTLRNKLCKQYSAKIENYQERIDKLANELYEERKKRLEAQRLVEELKEKVEQYEDWNRRLQEFMDMNEDDRKVAYAEMKTDVKLGELTDMFTNLFGGTFFGM